MVTTVAKFVVTEGVSIVANGVIRKYGLKQDASSRDKIWFYRSGDALAVVRRLKEVDAGKRNVLYSSHNPLIPFMHFDFSNYGGVNKALVLVSHPEQGEILREIRDVSGEFAKTKLHPEPIRLESESGGEIYSRNAELYLWGQRFYEEFSRHLPMAVKQKIGQTKFF